MTQRPIPGREFSVASLIEILTPILVLPGVCALVATAHYLGAAWLAYPALGLPAGVWIVILAVAWARLAQQHRRASPARLLDRAAPRPGAADPAPLGNSWPANPAASRLLDAATRAASLGADLSLRFLPRAIEDSLASWHDQLPWPARPLRIGLAIPPEAAQPVLDCDGLPGLEWFTLPAGPACNDACRTYCLDAAVIPGPAGALTVLTPVARGREAAWYDWAGSRPLSYASVFPPRVDVERVTIENAGEPGRDPALLRALIEAAAMLSRTSARLALADRFRGRRPVDGLDVDPADECVRRIGLLLARQESTGPGIAEARAAAHLVTAHLAAHHGGDEREHRRLAEAAAAIADDQPEVVLRLAAVRIGAGDDIAGIQALLRADRLLRGRAPAPEADHLVFVQSEFAQGTPDRLTLGRIAAGVCLLAANSPVERLRYLRDDLFDEIRHLGWLVGADTERSLLNEVFRALERARKVRHAKARAA